MPRQHERSASAYRKLIVPLLAIGVVLIVGAIYVASLSEKGKVQVSWLDDPPKGSVRFCSGEDVSASQRRSKRDYNDQRGPGSVAQFAASAFSADEQHDEYLKLLRRKSDQCDVIYLDVIYMAEFAKKGLLYDMTPYLDDGDRRSDFVKQAFQTVEYDGKLWGVPKQTDAGVMYYRADLARKPTSWRDVYRQAKAGPGELPGLRLPRAQDESLTVVLLELAYTAGARQIISEDGKTADLNQPPVLAALMFLRNAVRERVIPKRRVHPDKSNLAVYEQGRAKFLRGWPFVAAQISEDADGPVRRRAARNTKIIPLPPWQPGGRSVGVLGGHDLVIPRSAGNPAAALHLIEFLTSAPQMLKDVNEDSQLPVLVALTNDPGLSNRPVLNAVKETMVIPRPSITNYFEVSKIISTGVAQIMDGTAPSIQTRLDEMQHDVQRELDDGS
jgi:multiple sugar transport system substrate-binding protein